MNSIDRTGLSLEPAAADRARLRMLTRIGRTLTNLPELHEALRYIALSVREMLAADECRILVQHTMDAYLSLVVNRDGVADVESNRGTLSESLLSKVCYERPGTLLAVPLMSQSEVIGLLAVCLAPEDSGRADDEWFLNVVGDQASVAIAHAMHVEKERRDLARQLARVIDDPERRQVAMSALAHDLRSPLLAINIGCDILEESITEPSEEQRDVIAQMRVARQHLQMLAENLVEMGRLNVGLLTVHGKQIALRKVMDGAIAIVTPEAASKEQTLSVRCDGDFILWADPNRLRQILVNLLGNAIKYSPMKSPIVVECEEDGGPEPVIVIRVIDNGPGIDADQREVIFLPYQRTALVSGGIGLGLTIARELARRMGGDVTVDSPAGPGSVFVLRLPVRPASE